MFDRTEIMLAKYNLAKNKIFNTEDNVPAGNLQEKNMKKLIFSASFKVTEERSRSKVGSDTDPRIRIRTKTSWIRNFSLLSIVFFEVLSYLCNHLKSEAVSASSSSPRRSATDIRVILT